MRTKAWRGILKEFGKFLPVTRKTPQLFLGEGNTTLLEAKALARNVGFDGEIFFKMEGQNPSGSFKDRGMVVAVAKALEEGSQAIICASTGNTAASAAAYAAHAGIRAIVVLPAGKVAKGKLAQTLMYGASVMEVDGNFDDALRVVREITAGYKVALVNSINPYRLEGQKTAAFEILETLQRVPDFHFIPVGNAGNITAYWNGYKEYAKYRLGQGNFFRICSIAPIVIYRDPQIFQFLPRMMGYQAAGAAPMVQGHVIEHPETIASAIRIGNPARWKEANAAVRESNGLIDAVADEEILKAYKLLHRHGIACEPSSATGFAGFMKAHQQGLVPQGSLVVCTLTGNSLKDSDTAISACTPAFSAPANSESIANIFGLEKK